MSGSNTYYALRVEAEPLMEAIKKVNMAVNKNFGFTITVSEKQKGGMNRCRLIARGDTIQAVASFYAEFREVAIAEDGGEIPVDKPLERAITFTVSPHYSEAVATFTGIESYIFFKVTNSVVEIHNSVSSIPISRMERTPQMTNPKDQKLGMTIKRTDLLRALKVVNLPAMAAFGDYECGYAIKPVYEGEHAYLRVYAASNYSGGVGEVEISQNDSSEFPALSAQILHSMLDAAKVDQILAVNTSEYIAVELFYRDGNHGKEVTQANIKTADSVYMLRPFVRCYPNSLLEILYKDAKMTEFRVTANVEKLKKLLPVLGIGQETSEEKKIEIHAYKDKLLICDFGGLKSKKTIAKTQMKEILVEFPEGKDEMVLYVGLRQFMKNLKPYEDKVTLSLSEHFVLLSGDGERTIHGLARADFDNKEGAPTEDPDMEDEEDVKE